MIDITLETNKLEKQLSKKKVEKPYTVLVNTLGMDKELWRQYRRAGIGGSDVGAIAGISKWRSAISVYLDKIGEGGEVEENEKMYWGTKLEKDVAEEFSLRTGKKVKRRNAMLQSKQYPFMLANVDREIIGENAVLECKTCGEYAGKEWDGEFVPDNYILQCQHYMAVGGYQKAYIAVLIGGQRFVWKEIARDEELISFIITLETEFWERVQTRNMPVPDGSKDADKVLKLIYPQAEDGLEKELDSEMEEILKKREELVKENAKLSATVKELEFQIDECENKLKALLGTAEEARNETWAVGWKNNNGRSGFDSKQLQKDMPDIYKKYYKAGTPGRTFKIYKKKEDE